MVTRQKDEILKIFVECHRMSANSGVWLHKFHCIVSLVKSWEHNNT
jgi:hypothetical protein